MRLLVVAAAICLSVGSAACGSDDASQVSASERGAASASTTSIQPADGTTPAEDPVVEDPEKVLSTNPNDQSSPIGALCWARWEVARHLLLSTASDKSALEAAQDIATSAGATDEAWKGLPVEVQPFGDALLAATNTVKSEAFTDETAMDRLEAIFDFESFPAAKDYTNAAAQSTDCVRP